MRAGEELASAHVGVDGSLDGEGGADAEEDGAHGPVRVAEVGGAQGRPSFGKGGDLTLELADLRGKCSGHLLWALRLLLQGLELSLEGVHLRRDAPEPAPLDACVGGVEAHEEGDSHDGRVDESGALPLEEAVGPILGQRGRGRRQHERSRERTPHWARILKPARLKRGHDGRLAHEGRRDGRFAHAHGTARDAPHSGPPVKGRGGGDKHGGEGEESLHRDDK
mmetsp:Transcript_28822/g.84484  ORF Transcript_28822/g.84484 Transcript_28822/m.84484 type:complete len:223 (+) Transcript_28822:619-1287(+)